VTQRIKVGHVEITSTVDSLLAEVDAAANLPSRIWGSVYSELHYAVYVEFGTAYMLPKAMIRNSLPAIEAKFVAEWQALPIPPTRQQLLDLVDRVVAFALAEIKARTPVKSGDLQKSWEPEAAQAE
jgi:hypothetical protein